MNGIREGETERWERWEKENRRKARRLYLRLTSNTTVQGKLVNWYMPFIKPI